MTKTLPLSEGRDAPGWYGKLAALGDFAQRRLPPDCLSACDAWLSSAMRSGQERCGERWLDLYLTAPLLRFAWAPGIIDGRWWFGLLMPSCDSVGRYFPLLIAHPRLRAPEDRIALDHLELWYDHLAEAAMQTLHDGEGSLETLEAALIELPPWPTPSGAAPLVQPQSTQRYRLRAGRAAALTQWVRALAMQELGARLGGCSLWWRMTKTAGDDTVDIVRGLPNGAQFAALLSGEELPT